MKEPMTYNSNPFWGWFINRFTRYYWPIDRSFLLSPINNLFLIRCFLAQSSPTIVPFRIHRAYFFKEKYSLSRCINPMIRKNLSNLPKFYEQSLSRKLLRIAFRIRVYFVCHLVFTEIRFCRTIMNRRRGIKDGVSSVARKKNVERE
jgi:hypothetical protein